MDHSSNEKPARSIGLTKDLIAALYDDTENPKRTAELRRKISAAKARHDLNLAFKLCRAAEKEFPKSWEFSFSKAQVLRSMHCYVDALPILERLYVNHPSQSRIAVALADTVRVLGDVTRAQELLITVTPKKYAYIEARINQLRVLKSQNLAQQALLQGEATLNALPNDLRIVKEHADTMTQLFQYGAAANLLDQHLAVSDHEDGLFLARADLAMLSGQLNVAGQILSHCPHDLETLRRFRRLDQLQMAGTARSDALIGTQCLITSIDGPPEKIAPCEQLKLADLRFLMEDWRGAMRHYRLSGSNKSRNRMRTMRIATCHFKLLEFEACRNAIQRVLAQSPCAQDALALLAQLDLLQGHTQASIETTRKLYEMGGSRRVAYGVRLYKAYMRLEDIQAARQIMDQLIAHADTQFEPDLVNCLMQFGAVKQAYDICEKWFPSAHRDAQHFDLISAVGAAAGKPFEDAPSPVAITAEPAAERAISIAKMRRIGAGKSSPAHQTPIPSTLLTAWKVADQSQMSFDAWQTLVRHATLNSSQMGKHSTPAAEIEAFGDFPDPSAFGEYADPTIPVILTGSHFGPLVSSTLQENLLKDRNPVYLRTQQHVGHQQDLLITTDTDPKAAAIMLVKALQSGKTISSAVDAPVFWQSNGQTQSGAHGQIFGVPITISSTPVKLAIAFDAPIFWVQPLWVDGRIRFDVVHMKQPDPKVPFQDAADAWAEQYLKLVEAVMQSGPENQNLNAPMWQHLLYHGFAAHPSKV